MEAKHVEEKGELELGYFEEDDYGVLLVDEGKSYLKKWIIDTACSSIFVREKFTKFESCEKKMPCKPNDKRVNVKSIG